MEKALYTDKRRPPCNSKLELSSSVVHCCCTEGSFDYDSQSSEGQKEQEGTTPEVRHKQQNSSDEQRCRTQVMSKDAQRRGWDQSSTGRPVQPFDLYSFRSADPQHLFTFDKYLLAICIYVIITKYWIYKYLYLLLISFFLELFS